MRLIIFSLKESLLQAMSKTVKETPKKPRARHPKKYTDPIEDVDQYIEEELEADYRSVSDDIP